MPLKPWTLVSSRKSASFRIFDLRIDRAGSPRTEKEYDFYILESRDWVNVIPITPQNEVVLIRQYRHGIRALTLEIPGGIVEEGDSPLEAAQRELQEETGHQADEWISLGTVFPNPAFLTNRCFTYLAMRSARVRGQEQDEKEDIEVTLSPLDHIPGLIQRGEISHSLVLAAFYRFYMEYLPGVVGKTPISLQGQ